MPLAPHRWQALAPPAANTGLAITIDGYRVDTTTLDYGSVSIRVATHGNSLGTLDATLNDPTSEPVTEQVVRAFAGTLQLFEGRIKSVEVSEWKQGSHKFASFSAQDQGPSGALPTAAPFGLSDTPNGTTTFGYKRLRKLTRTTEGGSPVVSYETVYQGNGLWANMLLPMTSTLLGLSATSLLIEDAQVTWPNPLAPTYTFQLGNPLVRLSQLVMDAAQPDPGSITSTMISDGAISTPKFAANWANIGGNVVISPTGITITANTAGGAGLTVASPSSTVIIDGTSDMFRIVATGTVSHNIAAATAGVGVTGNNEVTLTGLGSGFTTTPGFLTEVAGHIGGAVVNSDKRLPGRALETFFAAATQEYSIGSFAEGSCRVVAGQLVVRIGLLNAWVGSTWFAQSAYWIFVQTGI